MAGTIETPVQQICEFLKLVSRGGVFETRLLRCKTRSGRPFTMSGYWNDPLAAAEDLVEADQEYEAAASYVTLNAINPALLSRASNRLEQYPENTTSDADVVKRTRLGNGRSRPRFAAGRCYRFRGCRRQRPGWSCRQCLNRHDRLASPRRLCPGRLWGQPLAPVPRLVRAGCAGHLRLCRASRRRPGSWGGRGSSLCGVLLVAAPVGFSCRLFGRPAARFRGPSPAKEPSGCWMAVCGLAGNCVGRSDARGCSWPRRARFPALGRSFCRLAALPKSLVSAAVCPSWGACPLHTGPRAPRPSLVSPQAAGNWVE